MNKEEKSIKKTIFAALTGIVSLIYIINPSAGVLELIPDNLPFIGNLDEAAATVFLIASIRYFGPDLSRIFLAQKASSDNIKLNKDKE